ncbi:MAG: hypothetical protein K2H14_04940 [Muribaculaceae bacterium]|nr:hypothetical protein [Muribaculaceae bacterium]
MKNNFLQCVVIAVLTACAATSEAQTITSTFNPQNVILPSSQYTPDDPYTATVWVFNDGRRYNDQYYNQILATPEADAEGHEWYHPDYELTPSQGIEWQNATAPFSSDEYYKGHRSFRWVEAEIMAEMYMRRTFTLNDYPTGTVFLACGHDDAPSEWYLNGELIHTVSDGWNNDEYLLLSDDQKALLKTDGSENLLAVHVHQNWGGAFADCGLYAADMAMTRTLLNTVGDGEWPCNYYILNYNSDLADAEACEWYSENEDESDWMSGVGPFSNDQNMFFITEWASQVRPILIRRHFSLSAEELKSLNGDKGELKMTCSYDENPKMYLNGTLIWSASGWNDNNYAEHILNEEQKALLKEGDNVLAVSLMQGGGGGHIDYGLKMESPIVLSGIAIPEASATETANDNRVFNLNGQYLGESTDGLPAGIYIKGGKKLIIL